METDPRKVKKKTGLIIANFGGPRDAQELPSFLQSLLCDQEVVRTPLPGPLHRFLFSKIAKKRAKKVVLDYESIGGKSPIYEDTEKVASDLRGLLPYPIYTFHRYLPKTHPSFIRQILLADIEKWLIFPMFPQFSYATTGSVAKWFYEKFPSHIHQKFFWLKSYCSEPSYVHLFSERIRLFLSEKNLSEKDCFLFFSAHGIPKKFVTSGDPYQFECEQSYEAIMKNFPKSASILAYQSKFGPGEWLRPYTIDICQNILNLSENKKNVIFIPLAFTSDHLETLFEIEDEYMPIIEEKGLKAYRLPAFNQKSDWIQTIADLVEGLSQAIPNQMLLRK